MALALVAFRAEAKTRCGSGHLTDSWYTLLQVDGEDTTNGKYTAITLNEAVERVIVLGRQTTDGTITINSASDGYCGKYYTGSTWATDTAYAAADTWRERFVVIVPEDGSDGARFPRNLFVRTHTPKPGTKWSVMERLRDGTCKAEDGAGTVNYFYKVQACS